MDTQVDYDQDGDLILIISRFYQKPKINERNSEGDPNDSESGKVIISEDDKNTDEDEDSPEVESVVKKTDQTEFTTEQRKCVKIRCRVSSKHMMLASPVFKAMLQHGNFKEGKALANGQAEIPLPDDNAHAFQIILNLIHNRSRMVPRHIDLAVMTAITILVDKYQMVETVEVLPYSLITNLEASVPVELCQDVYNWFAVSWVFGKRAVFKDMTRILLQHNRGSVKDTLKDFDIDLPILGSVLDALVKFQEEAITQLYGLVQDTIMKYQGPAIHCTRGDGEKNSCDAMLLGTMLKSAISSGVYPHPSRPYSTVSFHDVVDLLLELEVESPCQRLSKPMRKEGKILQPAHGFRLKVDGKMKELEIWLSGFDIEDFKEVVDRIEFLPDDS